ncbi:MAG: TM0106 family RecB-like putative nuclease, partial [Candidatus Uhrbacteria bacterium]
YVKCPLWLYFDIHQDEQKLHEPLMARLLDDGLLDEKQKEIISDRQYEEVQIEDIEQAWQHTLELMHQGKQTIYHGVLVHQHWVGRPDLLERVEGKSKFGDYYYVACDIKQGRRLRREYMFQGAFYAEVLDRIQGVKPVQGYVINPDGQVMNYLIQEFASQFHLSLDKIERIVAGKKPAHFVTSGCKQSPWRQECQAGALECNDVTLLNRIYESEINSLRSSGFGNISALAKADISDLEKKVLGVDRQRLLQLRDQATAVTRGKHLVRQPVIFPPAEVELYFDVEADPLRDLYYLFGVLEVNGEKSTYHSFLAKKPEDEQKAWQDFIDFMRSRAGLPVYHYGWFEIEVIRIMAKRYGTDEDTITEIEGNMLDLYLRLRDNICFPTYFYALKDIAQYIGYKWKEQGSTGADSVLWYEDYLSNRRQTSVLKKVVKYNEDDVRATWLVKKWAEEQEV